MTEVKGGNGSNQTSILNTEPVENAKDRMLHGMRVIMVRDVISGDILPFSFILGRNFRSNDEIVDYTSKEKRAFYQDHGVDKDGLTLEDRWVKDIDDFKENYPDLQPRQSHPSEQADLLSITDPILIRGRLLGELIFGADPLDVASLQIVQEAAEKAEHVHQDQNRLDGSSYVLHPYRVAFNLAKDGVRDPKVIVISLLHDVLEDSEISPTPKELAAEFGQDITNEVVKLSKKTTEGKMDEESYFEGLALAGETTKTIKVYDRIDNLVSLSLLDDNKRKGEYVEETRKHFYDLASFDPNLVRKLDAAVNSVGYKAT